MVDSTPGSKKPATKKPATKKKTLRWKLFEDVVTRIQQTLQGADAYDVETGVLLKDDRGVEHEIDVLLKPRHPYSRPVLVSCKAEKRPLSMKHVSEWYGRVEMLAAAEGVIVSESGFTKGAIDIARSPRNRLSLWRPRPLTLDDFGPDERSPEGYIAAVSGMGRIWVLLPDPNSLTIDAEREDGISEGRSVALQFGAHVREQWDLFDSEGAVVANVWDVFVERWKSHVAVGTLRMETGADRFVILEGIKFRIKALSVEVIATPHDVPFEVDMLKLSIGYENAVTGKMLMVPMPPSWLELRREHGGE